MANVYNTYEQLANSPYLLTRVDQKQPNQVYKYKICLIGDGGTGKTTFINKVINGDFISYYYATQGAVTRNVTLGIGDNSFVCYEVWDTAGQEKNSGLKDCYYIDAVGAFFFFDINSRETMNNIPKHVKNFLNATTVENPKIFVLANKNDIIEKKVNFEALRIKMPSCDYEIISISAKTGDNFDKPFMGLTRHLFKDPELEICANIDLTPLATSYDHLAGDAVHTTADEFVNFAPEE